MEAGSRVLSVRGTNRPRVQYKRTGRTRAQQIPKVEFQWQGKLDRKRSRSIAVQEPEMRTFANLPVEMLTEVINFACSYVVTAAVIPFVCHLWKEAAKPWADSEY